MRVLPSSWLHESENHAWCPPTTTCKLFFPARIVEAGVCLCVLCLCRCRRVGVCVSLCLCLFVSTSVLVCVCVCVWFALGRRLDLAALVAG